jgi:hypothetical protein
MHDDRRFLASNVISCSVWAPEGDLVASSCGESLTLPACRSSTVTASDADMQIPELKRQSHTFANAGERIVGLAAVHPRDYSDEIAVAVATAAFTASQIPGVVAEGAGLVQFWKLDGKGSLNCHFALSHEGGRSDALEWCPSNRAFKNSEHGDAPQERLGLLMLLANQKALIFSVPADVSSISSTATTEGTTGMLSNATHMEHLSCRGKRCSTLCTSCSVPCSQVLCGRWS